MAPNCFALASPHTICKCHRRGLGGAQEARDWRERLRWAEAWQKVRLSRSDLDQNQHHSFGHIVCQLLRVDTHVYKPMFLSSMLLLPPLTHYAISVHSVANVPLKPMSCASRRRRRVRKSQMSFFKVLRYTIYRRTSVYKLFQ